MNVYVLRYEFAHHGENFTRSVHMTHKGALQEQCIYLLEVLFDMDWEDETLKELVYISETIEKDDPITIDDLIQHLNVLEHYAECGEIFTEVEEFRLFP